MYDDDVYAPPAIITCHYCKSRDTYRDEPLERRVDVDRYEVTHYTYSCETCAGITAVSVDGDKVHGSQEPEPETMLESLVYYHTKTSDRGPF